MVIDGDSKLNDSATQIGGMTGENGSKSANVTARTPTGRKSRLQRRCTITPARDGQHRYYFTVVTSPDSDKAKMWGHMPETTTAATAKVFSARCYRAEIASGVTHGDNTENNEAWGSSILKWRTTPAARDTMPTLADVTNRCTTAGPAAP